MLTLSFYLSITFVASSTIPVVERKTMSVRDRPPLTASTAEFVLLTVDVTYRICLEFGDSPKLHYCLSTSITKMLWKNSCRVGMNS